MMMMMAWSGGRSGWGQFRWRDRLTCQRVYLRLMTRGLARGLRRGRSRAMSSRMAWVQSRSAVSVVSGGKGALLGDGAATDAQGGDERDPVGIVAGVGRGVEHEGADGVVAAQMPPDLLEDQVR